MPTSKKNLALGPLMPFLDKCPPFLCYALARKSTRKISLKHKRYTLDEISARSGIPKRTCFRIYSKLTWHGIKPELASAFFYACEVNPFRLQSQKEYVKKTSKMKRRFSHLLPSQLRTFENQTARWELRKAAQMVA